MEELKTEPVKEGKKRKRKKKEEDQTQEKKGKKKSVKGQKVRLWVPPCVFNYKNTIEL